MGRHHSDFLTALFPAERGVGVDIPGLGLELKESKTETFALKPKDEKADYFLFYHNYLDTFWLVDKCDIPQIKHIRSISISHIKRIAIMELTFDNVLESLLEFFEKTLQLDVDFWEVISEK